MSAQPSLLEWARSEHRFNGPAYESKHDKKRLSEQHVRIRELMLDGQWRSIRQISELTGDPEASVSAQLRHLRKDRFGAFQVERRSSGNRANGLFVYRVLPPNPAAAREHGADSKQTIQHLREELKLLKSAANMAVDLLEEFEMDGPEGHRVELVIQKLRERAAGMKAVSP